MSWEKVSANWERFKSEAKARWGFLSDQDLDAVGGNYERMVDTLERRYGVSKDRAREWLDAFVRSLGKAA